MYSIACSTSLCTIYIYMLVAALGLFLRGGSIRNINYKKYKTKKNLNISISPKKKKTKKQNKTKKKKIEIHKILQLHSMIFHILKLLHDIFIINPTSYIYFNVYNQTNIHPLISHLIDLFRIC